MTDPTLEEELRALVGTFFTSPLDKAHKVPQSMLQSADALVELRDEVLELRKALEAIESALSHGDGSGRTYAQYSGTSATVLFSAARLVRTALAKGESSD